MDIEENIEDQEYEDGLNAGAELFSFQIGTIQTAIEGMDWSASFVDGIWDGRREVEKEYESAFYEHLRKEAEAYRSERRMVELDALQHLGESEVVKER